MIARSVAHKAEVVSADEKEQGVRALLNFGHTFAHAIETLTGYEQFLHGEAVAIGMLSAAIMSEQTVFARRGSWRALHPLCEMFGLLQRGLPKFNRNRPSIAWHG